MRRVRYKVDKGDKVGKVKNVGYLESVSASGTESNMEPFELGQ